MTTSYCPTCLQSTKGVRVGVRLPLVKAEIFDAVEAAGANGITSREVVVVVYRGRPVALSTIRKHMQQIDAKLAGTGWGISCSDQRRWVLTKPRQSRTTSGDVTTQPCEG